MTAITQAELGGYVSAKYDEGRDNIPLSEVAQAFDISEATARRKLDGLVHQGLLVSTSHPTTYSVKT